MERDSLTMIMARNLEALIAARGTNAAQLAKAAKVNPTGVYDILSGKSRSPRLDTIHKLAKALMVSPAALFSEDGIDEIREEILAAYDELPLSERRRLALTAEAWAAAARRDEQAS